MPVELESGPGQWPVTALRPNGHGRTTHCAAQRQQYLLPTSPLWNPVPSWTRSSEAVHRADRPGRVFRSSHSNATKDCTASQFRQPARELIPRASSVWVAGWPTDSEAELSAGDASLVPTRSGGTTPRHLSPRCNPWTIAAETPANHDRSRRTPPGLFSNSASRLRVHDLVFAALDMASSKTCAYNLDRKLVSTAVLIPGSPARWENIPSLCPLSTSTSSSADDGLHHSPGNAGTKLERSYPCRKSQTPTNHQIGGGAREDGWGPCKVTNTTCSCRLEQSLRVFRPDRRHVWPRMRPPVAYEM